jgi:hypothetical protein
MSKAIVEIFPSAARTATPADASVSLPSGATALTLLVDVTAITATPTITVSIFGLVPGSDSEYVLLESSGISSVSVTQLEVGPGLVESANHAVSALLPQELMVRVTHGDADSITYAVWAILI